MTPNDYHDWLSAWKPRPMEESLFAPAPIAPWTCPECGEPASIGLRVGGLVNVRCAAHGVWYVSAPFSFTHQELTQHAPREPSMNPEARLWFLHAAARVMLDGESPGFLIAEVQGHPCEYEFLDREEGHELSLQVSSREWDCVHCGNDPLTRDAGNRLDALGFARPGPHLNAWQDKLPQDARELAVLLERGFVAAYEPPRDFEIALYASGAPGYARLVAELT